MFPALLLLLCSLAEAFDVLKTDALLPRVEETSVRAGGTIILAAAGAQSEQTLRKLLRAHPEAPCSLERVPLMGDSKQDMDRLLGRSSYTCALRVAPGGAEGEWLVSEHGACGRAIEAPPSEGGGWVEAPVETAETAESADAPRRLARSGVPSPQPAETLDPTRLLLLDHSVPDPTTALLSSFLVGFGAGHFYAHDTRNGWIYAGVQAGGLALYGLSRFAVASAFTEDGRQAAQAFGALGLGLSFGARMVDAATAPAAAQIDARRQIERQIP